MSPPEPSAADSPFANALELAGWVWTLKPFEGLVMDAEAAAEIAMRVEQYAGSLPRSLPPEVVQQLAEAVASDEVRALMEPRTPAVDAEQLLVQLAGCGVAALGGTSPEVRAERGDYGWSPSYQDVMNLREHFDEAEAALRRVNEKACTCGMTRHDADRCEHCIANVALANIRRRMTEQGQGGSPPTDG